jgi:hypothetical protein
MGRYRTAIDHHLPSARFISHADLGEYILSHLDDRMVLRAVVSIAY